MAEWDFSCPDWFERLKAGRSLMPDLPLDEDEAARAVAIFNKLRLPDVAGHPPMGEAAGEWFRDIVRAVFGSLDPETNVRRVAEIFAMVPKKNSKTTGGAGVMLTALLVNKRPRAEFLFIGPTQDIADLAFQQAVGMIEADESGTLRKIFHVQEHLKAITDRRNKARLKVKTFDMRVMTGVKPVGVLLDELHVMSGYSYAQRVLGQIRGGMIANPDGFLVMITTQCDEPPAGVFRAELQHARAVRDGRARQPARVLPIIYEFPQEMQADPTEPWADPAMWPMVLPNLGLSISLDRLKADAEEAREKGRGEWRRWASQHLNIEIGIALHSDRWRGTDYWAGAALEDGLTLEQLIERSDVATVGIDGGGLDDLLGLAVIGRDRQTRQWLLWTRAWAQDDVLDKRKQIAERLMDFVRGGDLVVCRSPTEDLEEVASIVERLHGAGLLPERYGVGLDPMGVGALVDSLAERGIETEQNGGPVCSVPQGYRLSSAVWGMERKLKDGTLRHGGQPLMAWCVGNAKVEQRGNAVAITKAAAGKAKIDPLVAAFNAFVLMSRAPEAARTSSYLANRPLVTV